MSELKNFSSLFTLPNKIALITGGSRGIGLHTATGLLLAGCSTVIITARRASGAEGIDQAITKLNALPGITGTAVGIAANCADKEDIERLAKWVKERYGKLDILVANAGASWGSSFEEAPDEASRKILDLNVRGIFLLAQKFSPLLEKAATKGDPSRIVIVSSVAGITVPGSGSNGTIMYSVSKAAATHLGRNLASELAPRNITTNVVEPGFFPSKLANGLIEVLGGVDRLEKANPLARLGEPEDIAAVMVYICSRAGAYLNGASIPLDGGARFAAGRGPSAKL